MPFNPKLNKLACATFEQAHELSLDEFIALFERGEIGDHLYAFDWFAAKRALELWECRYRILSEIS